jgi:hypothetical protein
MHLINALTQRQVTIRLPEISDETKFHHGTTETFFIFKENQGIS